MKLYKVEIETTVYVVADEPDSAEDVALKAMCDDLDGCDVNVVCVDVPRKKDLPASWNDAYPFGDDTKGQQTCAWWIERQEGEE